CGLTRMSLTFSLGSWVKNHSSPVNSTSWVASGLLCRSPCSERVVSSAIFDALTSSAIVLSSSSVARWWVIFRKVPADAVSRLRGLPHRDAAQLLGVAHRVDLGHEAAVQHQGDH